MFNEEQIKELVKVPLPDNTVNFIAQTDIKIWPKKAFRLENCIDVVVPNTGHDSIISSKSLASKISQFLKSY